MERRNAPKGEKEDEDNREGRTLTFQLPSTRKGDITRVMPKVVRPLGGPRKRRQPQGQEATTLLDHYVDVVVAIFAIPPLSPSILEGCLTPRDREREWRVGKAKNAEGDRTRIQVKGRTCKGPPLNLKIPNHVV